MDAPRGETLEYIVRELVANANDLLLESDSIDNQGWSPNIYRWVCRSCKAVASMKWNYPPKDAVIHAPSCLSERAKALL